MLDLKYIRDHADEVRTSITRRGVKVDLDHFLELDKERSRLTKEVDSLRSQAKPKDKPGKDEQAKLKDLKNELRIKAKELTEMREEFDLIHRSIPNLLHPNTPEGADDTANKELRKVGEVPKLTFDPRDHLELGTALGVFDFERGAKVAGNGFYYLTGYGFALEMALINYVIGLLAQEGFNWLDTPDLAKNEILGGVGFAPRGDESNIYNIEGTDLSLIATAEITLAGFHAGETLPAASLPLRYAGLSRCFRKEAGSYGRESRGLYRVHQFTKLEMFIYSHPKDSEKQHEYLLALEERIFQGLGLPYRVVDVCAGDLGAAAYRKFDLEAWMPGRGGYGEVTSTSNTTDYQSRRLGIRYEEGGIKPFVHTLNGTAIAISRALLAILENYQQEDGSVRVPEALRPYVNFSEIRPRE